MAKSLGEKWMILIFFIWVFTGTPETCTHLFSELIPEWTDGIIMIPPAIGVSVFVQWLILGIILIIGVNCIDIVTRNYWSPFVMGAGLPHPMSYSGFKKDLYGWLVVRGGGAKKPFPREGKDVIINPTSHAFLIDGDIIVEAEVTPNRPLDETPADIKSYVRSLRGGLSGVKRVAVGYLTPKEQKGRTIKYINKEYTVTDFIELFIEHLKNYDASFQVRDNETEGLARRLSLPDEIGNRAFTQKQESAVNKYILKTR